MTLRVGLIGAAGHANYVRDGVRELGDAVICAGAPGCDEESIEAVYRAAGSHPDTVMYEDYLDLLDREAPDIVAVNPFFHLHAEVACRALERGIAVYCEKPLALDLPGLDRVRGAVEKTRGRIGIMLAFRYQAEFHTARRLVENGAIGKPTIGFAQKSYKRGNRPDFYRRRETFGGITPWVGIHAIDWLRWVSGCEYRTVRSVHSKLHRPDYPGLEDGATCLFELANGGSAVMSFDFLRPSGAPSHGDDRLRLAGELGVLEIREDCGLTLTSAAGVETIVPEGPAYGPFADFARSVTDPGHRCLIGPEEAMRVTEIALRVRDAADTGETVLL